MGKGTHAASSNEAEAVAVGGVVDPAREQDKSRTELNSTELSRYTARLFSSLVLTLFPSLCDLAIGGLEREEIKMSGNKTEVNSCVGRTEERKSN